MADRTITTPEGTTVSLTDRNGDRVVLIDHPSAPADMRPTEAGRIADGGFQPAPFAAWSMRPSVLRAIADLMDDSKRASKPGLPERECHRCGRRGTRLYVRKSEGWECSQRAACQDRVKREAAADA